MKAVTAAAGEAEAAVLTRAVPQAEVLHHATVRKAAVVKAAPDQTEAEVVPGKTWCAQEGFNNRVIPIATGMARFL